MVTSQAGSPAAEHPKSMTALRRPSWRSTAERRRYVGEFYEKAGGGQIMFT